MTALARSLLFVPGNRPDRFAKAAASGAHRVILDLEDAVAPADKPAARDAIAHWLEQGGTALVRINGVGTPWFSEDLRLIERCAGAGVMLPKAEPDAMSEVAARCGGRQLVALIETVRGVMHLRELGTTPGLTRIAFGSVDLSLECGITDVDDAMTMVRSRIVLESCYAGLPAPVDGVGLELQDTAVMATQATRSRQMGFGGKLCIHPRQVQAVNAVFRPGAEELLWARKVVAAFEASGGGAVALEGQMVDQPVFERARRVLAQEQRP